MMPEQVAVALRPPKSAAAVPDINEVTPMAAITMPTPAHPSIHGEEFNDADIASANRNAIALNSTTGGARRDWKKRSEISPPANPPIMPKMQSKRPQWSPINFAEPCGTCFANRKYHCVIPLRSTPEVKEIPANRSINGLAKTFLSRSHVVNSMCIAPDEASCVSRCGKSASSGVSLMSHASSASQNRSEEH